MTLSQTELDNNILIKDSNGQFKPFHDESSASLAADVTQPVGAPVNLLPASALPAVIPLDEHFLPASQATPDPNSKADFHFHPDDRQEIASELEKINSYLSANERKKYSVEKIAEKLVEKNQLKFSPEQYARFVKSLLSFFRQARSFVQMRGLLADSGAIGFGLDAATADKVMLIARSLKEKIESVDGVVVEAGGERGISAEAESLPKLHPDIVPQPPITPTTFQPMSEDLVQKKPISPEPAPQVIQPPTPTVVNEVPSQPAPEPMVRTAGDLPKVSRPMTDVNAMVEQLPKVKRPNNRVLGKVDELATMSLQDFRALDPDPRMRVAKILQRIINLGKESLLRRAQGIDGWRKNEVYQMYLAIGHQSLEQNMDINQAISALQTGGQPALSIEEFEAITDLNKHLRF
jgi:hypothetical protein